MREKNATYKIEDFGIGKPHKAQRRFIRSKAPNVYLLGGRGAGKTTAGVIKSLLYCLHPENQGYDFGLFAPTYRSLIRVAEPALVKMLEAFAANAGYSLLKRHYRSDHAYELINGSTIYCTSFERVDRIRSMSLGGCWIDEVEYSAQPYYTFGTIAAAVRGGGQLQVMLTSTPRGYRGLTKRFIDAVDEGDEDFHLIVSKTEDSPYITEAFIARLRATMSKSVFDQEVNCMITRPSATVYSEFRRDTHLVPYIYQEGTPFSVGIDPGYSHPAVLFIAHVQGHGENDRDIVFKEFVEDDVPEDKLIGIMDSMFKELGARPQLIASDRALPHFNQKMMRKWTDTRIKTRQSKTDQDVWSGIEVVRTLLDPTEGPPRLYFSDRLLQTEGRGVIRSFEQAKRKTVDGESKDSMLKDNVNCHQIDACSYWATAHYGKRGWQKAEKKVQSNQLYDRRMRSLHRR
jgi:hypothetical protein